MRIFSRLGKLREWLPVSGHTDAEVPEARGNRRGDRREAAAERVGVAGRCVPADSCPRGVVVQVGKTSALRAVAHLLCAEGNLNVAQQPNRTPLLTQADPYTH